MKTEQVILGIDPGTLLMGYAVITIDKNVLSLMNMDVLKLTAEKDVYLRLQLIHEKIQHLIEQYKPTTFAIEAPFFGKNVQSMLKLGRAQGVAIAAAIHAGINVTEYSPRKVKQSVTGKGNADKEQVWKMLQQILHIRVQPKYFDATDALAVAVCHYYQMSSPLQKGATNFKGWEEFISRNKERVARK